LYRPGRGDGDTGYRSGDSRAERILAFLEGARSRGERGQEHHCKGTSAHITYHQTRTRGRRDARMRNVVYRLERRKSLKPTDSLGRIPREEPLFYLNARRQRASIRT